MRILLAFVIIASFAKAETILYRAAAIHPADSGVIINGQMLVKDGEIVAIGTKLATPEVFR